MRLSLCLSCCILVIILVASTARCDDQETPGKQRKNPLSIPKVFNFADYVKKFRKNYNGLETLAKANVFFSRTLQIFKHNAMYIGNKKGYFLNQNEYIDMTADEAKRQLIAADSELVPIKESKEAPDMPADDYYQQTKDDDIHDGVSRGVNQISIEPVVIGQHSEVNFFEDSNKPLVETKSFLRDIRSQGELAKEIAQVVEMEGLRKKVQDDAKREEKEIMNAEGITKRVQPKDANKNFDSSIKPSQSGWGQQRRDFSSTFAELMMDDFGANLEPYPMPSMPTGPVLPGSAPREPVTISGLLNLVRDVYGVFSGGEEVVNPQEESKDEITYDEAQAAQIANSGQAPALSPPGEQSMTDAGRLHTEQMRLIMQGPVHYDIDWRRTGCVSRAKSQRECNACYVFAALDLMEFFYCQQTKGLIEFSTQYVIDCGHKTHLNGCQGGKLSNVGIFIKQFGIQTHAMYPYVGVEQQCPFAAEDDAAQRSYQLKPDIKRWKLQSDIKAWYEWLPKTPMIVGINMPADFLAYGGGIHDGQDCVPDMVHAMVLVGSGIQDGKTFWLLKNTFSYSWGEGGYFRLSKRAPLRCFNSAIVAKARF